MHEFITGARGLQAETRNYVLAITGRTVEDWAKPAREEPNQENKGEAALPATVSCHDLIESLKLAPNPSIAALQQRIDSATDNQVRVPPMVQAQYSRVPSWCKHLHYPNKEICGPIHQSPPEIRTSSLARLNGH